MLRLRVGMTLAKCLKNLGKKVRIIDYLEILHASRDSNLQGWQMEKHVRLSLYIIVPPLPVVSLPCVHLRD